MCANPLTSQFQLWYIMKKFTRQTPPTPLQKKKKKNYDLSHSFYYKKNLYSKIKKFLEKQYPL